MYDIIANKVMEHIKNAGCDDVIRAPFFEERREMALLDDEDWQEFFRSDLKAAIKNWPPSFGSLCHISVPKGRYTFRSIAYMTIADTIKFTALAFMLGETIEAKRLSDEIVFSNRFSVADMTLDKSRYDQFRVASKTRSDSQKYRVKVVTDIANFYDRLNIHKLENILLEIKCDRTNVKRIIHVLTQWSRQQSFGLPVGSDGTRLLAEAMLINVDKELVQRNIEFVRYVDDFRIFCADQEDAYEAMQVLDDALRREGLFVNSGKTRLIDLELEAEEKPEKHEKFEPVNTQEKVEHTTIIKTRYGSRIAKYYRFPGQETIERLQAVNLEESAPKLRDPKIDEDSLKEFVKAAIYAKTPSFTNLEKALKLYPHLIPYSVDAIIKEYERDLKKFDDEFLKAAAAYFRSAFEHYSHNDYFRIQCARVLCKIEDDSGDFLGLQVQDMNVAKEIVFAQIIAMLGDELPRPRLLTLLEKFASYGQLAKTALSHALLKSAILAEDEKRPLQKNLSLAERDPFIKRLLKPAKPTSETKEPIADQG